MDSPGFPSQPFLREDEAPDPLFYAQPRLVVHIDEPAIKAIGAFFEQHLPARGVILDLMSSWRSHLPEGFPKEKLVGVGLNDVEMRDNPQLDERLVHDLNADPALPFDDDAFDAAVVTVSIQYMIRPLEIFAEVHRILKPAAALHVIYSNRMFPTKAIALWQSLDDEARGKLITYYFRGSGRWEGLDVRDISPNPGLSDPVCVVSARKRT